MSAVAALVRLALRVLGKAGSLTISESRPPVEREAADGPAALRRAGKL
jgi:hypothetical protein